MQKKAGTDANRERHAAGLEPISSFERLLTELSARFINLAAADVDGAIDDALRRIAALIGADRGQRLHFSTTGGTAHITHSGAIAGVPRVAPMVVTTLYPWVLGRLSAGEPVVIHDVADLPAAAAADRARFQEIGILSNLTVPMRFAGQVGGALAFGTMRSKRTWEPEIVERVKMAADVFASALDHQRAQEALDDALRFETQMSNVLVALLTADRAGYQGVIESGLAKIAQSFGAQRATLWQRDPDGDTFAKTHRWLAPGVPKPADIVRDDQLPWVRRELIAGRVVRFSSHDDLPAGTAADAATFKELAISSAVIVPLKLGERIVGALSFASASEQRDWPDALVPRITMLGEVFATVFARDAAERREREAQAQAAHAARVGTMGMLAASLVHELTQPLAASLANAETASELLASAAPDLDEVRATVADIVSDDRRVGELIQQLRRFLRRSESQRAVFDVRGPINDALQLVARDAAERRILIDVAVDPAISPIAADRVQIQQVLLNLLSNACDAVAGLPDAARRVSLAAIATEQGLAIEVVDGGPRIDDETLGRMFQPFFTTKPAGMGLGLSISRSIAAAHGGTLTARSSTEHGTTFRLELPLRADDAQTSAIRAPAPPVGGGIVYVIDDDSSMRRALERQLNGAGYRTSIFDSAQAFLDHHREPGVGCVVSDVRMPGLSGLDLQASLVEADCDLPMLFISGHGDVPTTASALRAGAVDFLQKPFTRHALLAAIAEAMDRSRKQVLRTASHDDLRRRHGSLTAREREVFELVCAGMMNKQIADRLGAAEATIKIHRGRMMEKMKASSVADLVRMSEMLAAAPGQPQGR